MKLKAHKIALHPNNQQVTLMRKHCGYARIAFNAAYSEWTADNSVSVYDIKRRFNTKKYEVYDWCQELSQSASKNAIHDFWDAVERWRARQNKFPRRRRKKRMSYTASNGRHSIKVEGKRIQLPKIGWVRMREELRHKGDVLRVTISERAGRWYASILVETIEVKNVDLRGSSPVGVDVGISTLATTDDGTKHMNPRPLLTLLRKLVRCSRKLSRCVRYSRNWHKAKRELQRLHNRIATIRENNHHRESTQIANKASILCIESLTVKGLMRNRKLARALADASLSSFLTMLKYKTLKRGAAVVVADKWYPSSRLCNQCKEKNTALTLSDRVFECPTCGHTDDRDVNAAKNLKHLAEIYADRLNDCGENVSPKVVRAVLDESVTSAHNIIFIPC